MWYVAFRDWLPSLAMFSGFVCAVVCVSTFFLCPSNIPFSIYPFIHIYLSIHPLMTIWVASTFWLLPIRLCELWGSRFCHLFVFKTLWVCPRSGPAGSMLTPRWPFGELLDEPAASFKIPTKMYEGSNFPTSLLLLFVVQLFGFSLSSDCEVIPHCAYDLLSFIQIGICVNLVRELMS